MSGMSEILVSCRQALAQLRQNHESDSPRSVPFFSLCQREVDNLHCLMNCLRLSSQPHVHMRRHVFFFFWHTGRQQIIKATHQMHLRNFFFDVFCSGLPSFQAKLFWRLSVSQNDPQGLTGPSVWTQRLWALALQSRRFTRTVGVGINKSCKMPSSQGIHCKGYLVSLELKGGVFIVIWGVKLLFLLTKSGGILGCFYATDVFGHREGCGFAPIYFAGAQMCNLVAVNIKYRIFI